MTTRTTDQIAAEHAVKWLEQRRAQIHERNCIWHNPDARCSCGFNKVMTYLRAIQNNNTDLFIDPANND